MTKVHESVDAAVADIPDGVSIALHSWGLSGSPHYLIAAIMRLAIKDLTLICPNFMPWALFDGELPGPVSLLPQLKKVISAFIRARTFDAVNTDSVRLEDLEIEATTHGTLMERLHAGAMGLGGFYNPLGAGTKLAEGKERRIIDGKEYVLETPLRPDVALVHAYKADRIGNLIFRGSSRAAHPITAMAAKLTIVEAEQIVEVGELDPNAIHTPSAFVDRIVPLPPGGMGTPEHRMKMVRRMHAERNAAIAGNTATGNYR